MDAAAVTIPILGYAVAWNTPGHPDEGRIFTFTPHALDRFAAAGIGVPLRLDHDMVVTSRGITQTIGAARHWRTDTYGLLTLAELDSVPLGRTIADDVHRGHYWGLSGAYTLDRTDPPDWQPHPQPLVRMLARRNIRILDATLTELSLTLEPSDASSLVLATGDRALELWQRDDLDHLAHTARATA